MGPITRSGSGRWALLGTLPHQSRETLTLAARLTERAPLLILDGGNHANIHAIARQAGWQAGVLERIRIARAFTCYQMANLLENVKIVPATVLVLDLLATFYDENVLFFDRQRLLKLCLRHMDRLAREMSMIVTAAPPPPGAEDSLTLYDFLLANAPDVHMVEISTPVVIQPRLF